MKTKIKIVALFLLLFAVTITAPQKANANGISISFQVFYDELSPYGDWVFNPEYGYVWLPNTAPGFFPYATDGYWVFTDDGWTWVSYYQWGWAPFHYGRWFIDPFYGPMWVPGYDWGPGWVVWSRSGNYYGWAPMGPGIGYAAIYGRDYQVPNNCWRFVRDRDFGRPHIYNYYIDNSTNITIINNTTVINNIREDRSRGFRYNAGPDRIEVERSTGRTFNPVGIKESSKPRQELSDNELVIYRPRVEKNDAGSYKPVPAKVAKLDNTKPAQYKSGEGRLQRTEQPQVQQKEAQPQHGKSAGKTEVVNQQPMREKPSGKPEAVKQQPKQDKPSGRTEAVKQQPKQDKPSGKTEVVKQPKQSGKSKNGDSGKQPPHVGSSKKVEKGR
jgi:hypothetical protein